MRKRSPTLDDLSALAADVVDYSITTDAKRYAKAVDNFNAATRRFVEMCNETHLQAVKAASDPRTKAAKPSIGALLVAIRDGYACGACVHRDVEPGTDPCRGCLATHRSNGERPNFSPRGE